MVLTLPGPDAARRVVSYYENNRAHLTPWEPPFPQGLFTVSFWERRLTQNRQEYVGGKSMRLALVSKDDPEGPLLGLTNFTQFVRGAFMSCTLGYSIDRGVEGRGLMHEALASAIRHLFDELDMHRIQANYMPVNERSGRLLRRLGFVVEGYGRDYIFINGDWRDHILTALLNDRAPGPDYLVAPPPTPRR
jgi:ribosomal-protein-alanine N-acetyltransferase